MADDIIVMQIALKKGTVYEIFNEPKHPYTDALLKAVPNLKMRINPNSASFLEHRRI